jgi:hypothetical protein
VDRTYERGAMLERKAVMKHGRKKIPGTFIVKGDRIIFRSLIGRKEFIFHRTEIMDMGIEGGVRKKLYIVTGKQKYLFSMKNVGDVYNLLLALPQHL